jgi:glyoxylate carboligase
MQEPLVDQLLERLPHDHLADASKKRGLGHLLMVPGGLVDPFLPALARQSKLKPIVAAHEGGAVYTADGDLQAQAAAEWGKRGLVEIVVLSGFYQMFAAINQGFNIACLPSGP